MRSTVYNEHVGLDQHRNPLCRMGGTVYIGRVGDLDRHRNPLCRLRGIVYIGHVVLVWLHNYLMFDYGCCAVGLVTTIVVVYCC